MEQHSQSKYGKLPLGVLAVINIIALAATHLWSGSVKIWNALRNARKNFRIYRIEAARRREAAALQNYFHARKENPEYVLYACTHRGFIAGAKDLQNLKDKLLAARCSLKNRNLLVVERSQKSDSATVFKPDGTVWLLFPALGDPVMATGCSWAWPSS
jgi:hypothetical protein